MRALFLDFVVLVVVPLAFLLGFSPDLFELAVNLFHAFSEHRRGTPVETCCALRSDVAAPGFVGDLNPPSEAAKDANASPHTLTRKSEPRVRAEGGNAHQRRIARRKTLKACRA